MTHHRRGLKLGKLFIPNSTLKGVGKVVGKVGDTALLVASAPEKALLNVSEGFKGGGSSWLIIGGVCVVGAYFVLNRK
jgi:hypothetical protein